MSHQSSLFDDNQPEVIIASGGDVKLHRHWLSADEADAYFASLLNTIQWQESTIYMHGKSLLIPRLNAWYGDERCHYAYSGIRFSPLPWLPELRQLKTRLELFMAVQGCRVEFNSVLANLYRHGQDSVAWHADDEPELGVAPVIASISLGATRRFSLKPKEHVNEQWMLQPVSVDLPHGSLLIMAGATQQHWLHQLPKTRQVGMARINLTFRCINESKRH